MSFWQQFGIVYLMVGGVIAIALAGWEFITYVQTKEGLRFREYPFVMLIAVVTWPLAVPALYRRMWQQVQEEEPEGHVATRS